MALSPALLTRRDQARHPDRKQQDCSNRDLQPAAAVLFLRRITLLCRVFSGCLCRCFCGFFLLFSFRRFYALRVLFSCLYGFIPLSGFLLSVRFFRFISNSCIFRFTLFFLIIPVFAGFPHIVQLVFVYEFKLFAILCIRIFLLVIILFFIGILLFRIFLFRVFFLRVFFFRIRFFGIFFFRVFFFRILFFRDFVFRILFALRIRFSGICVIRCICVIFRHIRIFGISLC